MSDVEGMGTMPLTREAVYQTARLWGGMPHGDDANGLVDISFPTIVEAAGYAEQWRDVTTVSLREPVTSFNASVVIQIQLRANESR